MNLRSKMTSLAILAAVPGLAASLEGPTRITTVVHADLHTGKLVRSVNDMDAAVARIAAQHSLPPQLLHSVIKVESNYNPSAVSAKGAQGLMQLIPSTARRFGVSDSFNPVENIQGGAKYLRHLLDLYHGDYPRALAAYNAGEAAVAKYGGVPPYAETQNYLLLVRKQLAGSGQPVVPARLAGETACPTGHIREVIQPDGSVRYIVQ